MHGLLVVVAGIGLGLTLGPAWAFFAGAMAAVTLKHLMLAGTALWFVGATGLSLLRRDG